MKATTVEMESRMWEFRPQALWWCVDFLVVRRRLFQPLCEEVCSGVCCPPEKLGRQEYERVLNEYGTFFTELLREGKLGGHEELVLLTTAWLIMCWGFPPLPTLRWALTWAFQNMPERVAQRLKPCPTGRRPEEILSIFWDPPTKKIQDQWENLGLLRPLYQDFGCNSWEELARLPAWELWRRFYVEGRWKSTAAKLVRLSLAYQEAGQERSISLERQVPLSKLERDLKASAEQRDWEAEELELNLEDSRWLDQQRFQELRLSLEEIIATAPPEQGKAGKLFLKSIETGESFRSVCVKEGEEPYKAKANLRRFLERARRELT